MTPSIYFNEDNEHFYIRHSDAEMTVAGCRALVDAYARTGTVRGLLFCVNMQRALYDSDVWERFRDIPGGGGGECARRLGLLAGRGVDQFAEWLARCRETGIEGWLSMRMNDSHGLKESVRGIPVRFASWHSREWEEHPEWRRAPWRDERSWEGSFDWGRPEVRRRALSLVREILGRWDLAGLELDWMRWGMFFRPGEETEGRTALAEFVRDVRRLADEAAERLGHPVRLAHRVPPSPEACLGLGFDVAAWARAGGVDMLTLSGFGNEALTAPPVALWRDLLGRGCRVNVAVGPVALPHAATRVFSWEIMRGAAAAAWAAGADGVYFFNACYREPGQMEVLERALRAAASPAGVAADTRRIALCADTNAAAGGAGPVRHLPAPLAQRAVGTDFARMERCLTFRLPAGPFDAATEATLELAFDAAAADAPDAAAALRGMEVRVNSEAVQPVGPAERPDPLRVDPASVFQNLEDWPRDAALALRWRVPTRLLKAAENAIEMLPPEDAPGHVVWCALRLVPGNRPGRRDGSQTGNSPCKTGIPPCDIGATWRFRENIALEPAAVDSPTAKENP